MAAYLLGQHLQQAVHFLLPSENQLLHIVIHIHHRHRLDEKGGAAGRLVVDNTREVGAILLLHGDDITLITHGDNGILKIFLVLSRVQQACNLVLDA